MTNKKDQLTTALLSWFLGMFGVHRFYLGQTGLGITYLVVTCTIIGAIITGIVSTIDFIGFVLMKPKDFDQKYNQVSHKKQMSFISRSNTPFNIADEIYKLDLLFRRGVITFEEFENRKVRLLNS